MLKTFVINNSIEVTKDGKPYCVIQAATDEDCRHIQNIITAQPKQPDVNAEWFFRWIARGKAGYAGMSMEKCADMIWHHPDNPYKDENPWQDRAEIIYKSYWEKKVRNENGN